MAQANEHDEMRPTALIRFVRGIGCLVVVVVVAAILLPPVAPPHRAWRPSCQNNMKQLGLTLKMYANEDERGYYPVPSRDPGRLMFDFSHLYPEYLPDPMIDLCPWDSDFEQFARSDGEHHYPTLKEGFEPATVVDDWSYFYLGYAVLSDEDVERFADGYLNADGPMDADILAEDDPSGARTIIRLREGVEQSILAATGQAQDFAALAQLQSEIPILIERVGNHKPAGAYILYLDGHVEFIKYPGKWPMTEKTVRILNELDALGN